MSTTPEVTITATAHTGCKACEMSAEGARSYVANGGLMTQGKAGNSLVAGGPHWASFTTEPAPLLDTVASAVAHAAAAVAALPVSEGSR